MSLLPPQAHKAASSWISFPPGTLPILMPCLTGDNDNGPILAQGASSRRAAGGSRKRHLGHRRTSVRGVGCAVKDLVLVGRPARRFRAAQWRGVHPCLVKKPGARDTISYAHREPGVAAG